MGAGTEQVQVWLVERTFSEDKPNLIILVYATPDGKHSFTKERALTNFSTVRVTTAAIEVDPDNLDEVGDETLENQYAAEATRMKSVHEPDDAI